MLRAPAAVALALTIPLALGACSAGAQDPDDASTTSSPSSGGASPSDDATTAPTDGADDGAGEGPAEGSQYVALGDSYTAAPLVPPTDTEDGCLRSDANYPHLLATALDYELSDVSCSGATTTSLIGVQRLPGGDTAPAQFDALAEDTELVTVSIGANDDGLFTTLLSSCLTAGGDEASESPCTDRLSEELIGQARALTDRTEAVVTGIQGRSPDARVVVVTYPRLLPESGACDEIPLAEGDYPLAREVNRALSDSLAAGARAAGAEVLDVYALSKGHDVCSEDPWVNGPRTDPGAALAYHPFAAEQEAVAQALAELVG